MARRGATRVTSACSLNEWLIRIILWSFSFLLKRRNPFFLLPAFFVLHENWRDSVSFQSSRSTNRSRCSRLIASSFGQNVCKGSRQNGSVTLEERVALEVEEVGWCTGVIFALCGSEKPQFPQGSWGGSTAQEDFGQYARGAWAGVKARRRVFFPFQLTTNQELMPTRGIRLFN